MTGQLAVQKFNLILLCSYMTQFLSYHHTCKCTFNAILFIGRCNTKVAKSIFLFSVNVQSVNRRINFSHMTLFFFQI